MEGTLLGVDRSFGEGKRGKEKQGGGAEKGRKGGHRFREFKSSF